MKSKGVVHVCACMHACVCFCTDKAENTFQLLPPSVFTLLLPSSTYTQPHTAHMNTRCSRVLSVAQLTSCIVCCPAVLPSVPTAHHHVTLSQR